MYNCLSAVPTATVSTLGNDVEDHLASLFATLPGTDNLNGLVLGLVTGDLDLGARLLAKVVDGSTSRSDNESMTCLAIIRQSQRVFRDLPIASRVGEDEVTGRGRLGSSLNGLLEPLTSLGQTLSRTA